MRRVGVDDTLALAAMMQAIVDKLRKLLRQNTTFRMYRRLLLDENRWHASRYGIDGKLIDFGRRCAVETRSLIHEILEFIAPEVEELGSHRERSRTWSGFSGKGQVRIGSWRSGSGRRI